ncbi:MAG: DUF4317 domain-containing protein [Ruminococcus sp.]|jgi:hypothetical protein|nr:DUF4317 domain-containing protein [Ruminococcus sp.]
MNKKELAEIKKHFSADDNLFTFNRILRFYTDAEKNVRGLTAQSVHEMSEEDFAASVYCLKKVLSGTMGKNIVEYPFPNEEYEEGGAQQTLYALTKNGLKNDADNRDFAENVAKTLSMETTYAVFAAHCTYSVIANQKSGEPGLSNNLDYSFIAVSVCPVSAEAAGLVFDAAADSLVKKSDTELRVSDKPSDGFVFPVFSDRAPDINCVAVYSKNTAKPNTSMVEGLLGCGFVRPPKAERAVFGALLENICGDELDYTKIVEIDKKISEIIDTTQSETELATVDAGRIGKLLYETGVSDERRAAVPAVFEQTADGKPFTAVNLSYRNINIVGESFKVAVSGDFADKIRLSNIEGRHSLVIDIDDPSVVINGIKTHI